MVAALVFYGALIAITIWASARNEDLRWVGASLGASYGVSNVIWFLGTPVQRPGIYSMLELFIIIATYLAWEVRRERLLIVLVITSTLSICANIGLAAIAHPHPGQVRVHEVLTNIFFMIECLLLTTVGVRDGIRTGRFDRWPSLRRSRAAPDAAAHRAEDA